MTGVGVYLLASLVLILVTLLVVVLGAFAVTVLLALRRGEPAVHAFAAVLGSLAELVAAFRPFRRRP